MDLQELQLPIRKKVSLSFKNENREYFLHRPLDIKQNISLNNYLDLIKPEINQFYLNSKGDSYPTHIQDYKVIGIKIYYDIRELQKNNSTNMFKPGHIFKRELHTQVNNNNNLNFKPINKTNNAKPNNFASMDLETMEFRGFQIPVAITFTYSSYNKINTIFKVIDSSSFQSINELDIELNEILSSENIDEDNLNPKMDKWLDARYMIDNAVNQLFLDFYNELSSLKRKKWIIFTHNLGSFDGYFIYKTLFELPGINIEKVKTIVDDRNQFITINAEVLDLKLVWKDSIRIFPVSLNELCKVFKVDGKFMEYNKEFNNLNLFKNNELLTQFQKYAEQDSICLFEALMKAQTIYINKYDIDITTILSTSTLSMKIFRTKFLDTDIPTLSLNQDRIIRESYFGGATDYYKLYGENLYYYDVNSLYPYAMCNDIPLKFEKTTDSGNLNEVFGFLEVNVYCPNTVKTPFLPVKFNNQTIYPHGKWSGIYFSEELKQAVKFGYEFEVIKIHHFSKAQIFSDKITISMNNFKTLVNNEYIAANINIISDSNYKIWSKKIVTKLIKVLKDYSIL